MSSFMAFGSRQISLAKRHRSDFALVVSCLCVVRIFLLLLAMPTSVVNGTSRPMRAGFTTGTHRCRSFEEAHSLLERRVCA
jgi:hypothetical protein